MMWTDRGEDDFFIGFGKQMTGPFVQIYRTARWKGNDLVDEWRPLLWAGWNKDIFSVTFLWWCFHFYRWTKWQRAQEPKFRAH